MGTRAMAAEEAPSVSPQAGLGERSEVEDGGAASGKREPGRAGEALGVFLDASGTAAPATASGPPMADCPGAGRPADRDNPATAAAALALLLPLLGGCTCLALNGSPDAALWSY